MDVANILFTDVGLLIITMLSSFAFGVLAYTVLNRKPKYSEDWLTVLVLMWLAVCVVFVGYYTFVNFG